LLLNPEKIGAHTPGKGLAGLGGIGNLYPSKRDEFFEHGRKAYSFDGTLSLM